MRVAFIFLGPYESFKARFSRGEQALSYGWVNSE